MKDQCITEFGRQQEEERVWENLAKQTPKHTRVENCVCEYREHRTDKSRMTFTLLFGSVSFKAIKQTRIDVNTPTRVKKQHVSLHSEVETHT